MTVIVPAYNAEAYLDKCLSTLAAANTGGGLEVVIVDDGSSDKTGSIAEKYAANNPMAFSVIHQENGGHGSAINAGIGTASGRYFRVVDADDWVDSNQLAALLDMLVNADADLVVDIKTEVDMATAGRSVFPLPDRVPLRCTVPFEQWNVDDMTEYYTLHTLTVRTDLAKRIQLSLPEHTYYEDFEYALKVTVHACSIYFADTRCYQYQIGNAGQSVAPQNYVRRLDQHRRIVERTIDYVNKTPMSAQMKAYAMRRIKLLIHTHLKIMLIYDSDKKKGAQSASEFMTALKARYPALYATVRSRYRIARLMNALNLSIPGKKNKL